MGGTEVTLTLITYADGEVSHFAKKSYLNQPIQHFYCLTHPQFQPNPSSIPGKADWPYILKLVVVGSHIFYLP